MPHFHRPSRWPRLAVASLAALALALPAVAGPPSYDDIVTLGFTDTEHTRGDGWQQSGFIEASPAGYVAGFSYRYDGSTQRGRSNWLHDGADLHRIGFTDGDHTRDDDHRWSHVQAINDTGQVLGFSWRYFGVQAFGQSAWIDDGTQLRRLGFTDTDHTASSGYQFSHPDAVNDAGQRLERLIFSLITHKAEPVR